MSKIETNTIDTISGSATMQIGSTNTSTINIGVSGDTVNIPSGVTFANSGTATGFGSNLNLFRAYRNGSFAINHDTWTNVNFNAENFDVNSKFDTSNGRYTPASIGYYNLKTSVVIEFANSNLGRRVGLRLLKNGSTVAENFQKFADSGFDALKQTSVTLTSIDYSGSASDYYEIHALQNNANGNNSAEIITDAYNTWFTGYKLIT